MRSLCIRFPSGSSDTFRVHVPQEVIDEGEQTLLAYCETRLGPELRDQIRLEVEREPAALTIVERRPAWQPDETDRSWTRLTVARFSYDALSGKWMLSWSDSDQGWHPYARVNPSKSVQVLLKEVDEDPTAIFWG
ncbi:MAG: DUF3024 domain-containing protein [Actinomycetota bacterium]